MKKIIFLISLIFIGYMQSTSAVIIFSDDFESGNLNAWNKTNTAGARNWTANQTDPFQGSFYAQSHPGSTTEPASVISINRSTIGFQNISLFYYRKLVGIDAADEFQVEWFNGTSWSILESTGGASANDASYAVRNFNLSSVANENANFQIKFECTAGAVSEFCRVDNVSLIGENIPDTTPPKVFLLNPPNATTVTENTTFFTAHFTDNFNLSNATLHLWNTTTLIGTNITSLGNASISTNLSFTLPKTGTYFWNYLAIDNSSNQALNLTNFTIIFNLPDTTSPSINFTSPTELSGSILTRNNILINVTASDTFLKNISITLYNASGFLINFTTSTNSPHFVNIGELSDGLYFFNATAYDDSNNKNVTETRNITLDTVNVPIAYRSPTKNSGIFESSNYIEINVTGILNILDTLVIRLYNSTNAQINSSTTSTSPNYINFSDLNEGLYFYNATRFSLVNGDVHLETRNITLDTAPPSVTALTESPSDPATYALNTRYEFNATITDASSINTVLLEFNGTNYTTTNIVGNIYSVSLQNLSAAPNGYSYKWHVNDSSGNRNATESGTYAINKATGELVLLLNNTASNSTLVYPSRINASAISATGQTITLLRNGIEVTTQNALFQNLSAGLYNFTAQAAENQNYSSLIITRFADLQRGILTGSISVSPATTVIYPNETTATITENNPGDNDVTYIVYRDLAIVPNPEIMTLGAGTYNYTLNTTGGQNWTSVQFLFTQLLNVNQAAGDVRLFINHSRANITIEKGTILFINATLFSPFSSINLTQNALQLNASNTQNLTYNQTFNTLGDFNISAKYAGNTNYTVDAEEWFVTVIDSTPPNIASLTESPSDPATYSQNAKYEFNATITDASSINTVLLEFNRINYTVGNMTPSTYNFSISNLAAGAYNYYWRINDSQGNVNVSLLQSYTINNATGEITLLINGTTSNQTASFQTKTNVSATTPFGTITLLLDGIDITANNHLLLTLAAGNYNLIAKSIGDQNHSATTITRFVHITQATPQLNLTFNRTEGNITVYAGISMLLNGTLITGDASATLELYRNSSLINLGTITINNQTNFTSLGLQNITLRYIQTQNYTENTKTYFINSIETPMTLNISCEAGGPYQQSALVLIQGNVTESNNPLTGQNVNMTLLKSNTSAASKLSTTTNDGTFETTFSFLSVGSFTLNSTVSYQGHNATCEDTLQIGSPANLVINKIASVYNTTNASITYNITLVVINTGGANTTNTNITDTDLQGSPYLLNTIEENATAQQSYLKNFTRNDTTSYHLLASATAQGRDTYSNITISASSTEINITIPATVIGKQIVITKNILYISEKSLNVTYNITSTLYNSGDEDLTQISYSDSDIKDTASLLNLSKGSARLLSNLKTIEKAASNTQHEFALGTATIDTLSFYSNRPKINIPGYGGPADVIVYAPTTISPSTTLVAIIEIKNINPDIGQDFPINYWITNNAETQNESSGQKTVYVAANASLNTSITLTAPSAAGNYKLKALAIWAGGTATAFGSFEVIATSASAPGPGSGSSGGGGSVETTKKSAQPSPQPPEQRQEERKEETGEEIMCNAPYIRYGKECCLDQNNNTLCDQDEKEEPQETASTTIVGLIIQNVTELTKANKTMILAIIALATISALTFLALKKIKKKKTRIKINGVSSIKGLKVYDSEGKEIGKVTNIVIEGNKIDSLKIKVPKKVRKRLKLNKKGIIINYKQVAAIKEIILLNKSIEEEISQLKTFISIK